MQDAHLLAEEKPSLAADGASHALRIARGVQVTVWAALLLACQAFWPAGQSGVFWGGLVMAGNLWAMRLSADRLARLGSQKTSSSPGVARFLALAFAGKFVALLAATAAIIEFAKPDPLGFFVGFATLLVGIMCAAPLGALRAKG